MSTRQDALVELRDRLQQVRVANGYATEAGQLVLLGEQPTLGESDPAAVLAIVVGADEPGPQAARVVIRLPVQVQALVRADTEDPWLTIEEILGDIKRAVEQDHDLDGTLLPRGLERGATTTLEREAGSAYVGAGVEYRLAYAEDWGNP